jgi:fibronectin type 3 domain-containing protein
LSFYNSLVFPPDTVPPSPPTGLSGVSGDPTHAAVTWTGSADNVGAAGYYVFRDGVNIGSAGFSYYQDSGLMGSKTYTYTVSAFDLAGNVSTPSLPVSVTTRDVVAPPAPTGLITTVVSCQQIKLSWSPSTDDVSVGSYRVFRGTSPSPLDQVGTTYGTTTTFTHYPLTPDTTYYFAVQAVDTSGNVSPLSPPVFAKTPALPSAPVNVAATPASPKQINVVWSPGPSGMPIGSYRIFRGSSPSDLRQVAVRAASPYSDISLSPSTRYCYGVEEVDTGGNVSPMSAVVCAVTMSPPAAPANLAATPVSTKQINLAWSAAIPGGLSISRYNVYRGTSSSTLLKVGSTTKTAFSSTALTPSTTYYFAVQAVDTGNNLSPMSETVPAATLALPSPPANLTATAASKTQVSLAWSAAESGMPLASYRLFRGSSPSVLLQFGTVAATKTSATDYPVSAGTAYYYAVKSVDTGGNVSAFSNIAQVTTPK